MGQKINPIGFRIGISKDWDSKWFADKKNYPKYTMEDFKVREALEKRFETAGVRNVIIERSVNAIHVTVHVSKPGIVIGRGGVIVEAAKKELETLTGSKVTITAEEVKTPEIEAQLVADYISRQMKRRKPPRWVVNSAITSAMDKGALGIKVKLSGLLGGSNSIARTETHARGPVPAQTLRANIDYAQVHCKQLFGIIGIKVWIYKGEVDL